MDDYKQLAKLFHADPSPSRFSNSDAEASVRLNSPSTFRTRIVLKSNSGKQLGELFLAIPRQLTVLSEETLRVERKVSRLWSSLPGLARWAHLRGLILDEIISTNEIEGIHSSRRQISRVLDIVHERRQDSKKEKFVELARLYLELSDRSHVYPREPKDIRAIYDRVVADDIGARDLPDGLLFRKEAVDVWDSHSKIKHSGAFPESEIIRLLEQMIGLVENREIPEIYAALLSHFLFEYIHPFYDGNGRTGRYLLALYLSEPLSITTVLSLSRVIAENKSAYYKAFDTVEDPLNRGEATFFVLAMMGLIRTAQDETISKLETKGDMLNHVTEMLDSAQSECGLSNKATELLYLVMQYTLFDEFGSVALSDAAEYMRASTQTARKYFGELETKGLARAASLRPLKFMPTTQCQDFFELRGRPA